MVRFAHVADCHLGSWRQQELLDLNLKSFKVTIKKIIESRVDFALFAGDIFDSAYPPIEILKDAFAEFKRLADADIPVFIIAGSHDYSASGKTFLDVLEKAGLCVNVERTVRHDDGRIELLPTMHEGIALYGYPGRKSGMELDDLRKTFIQEDGLRNGKSILMLHTTISDVIDNFAMNSIGREELPRADYYAMGHVHQRFSVRDDLGHFVYPGPTYPNNFQELVDLQHGGFVIVELDESGRFRTEEVLLPLTEVVYLEIEVTDAFLATEEVIDKLNKMHLTDKILLLRLHGIIIKGKSGDIRFNDIEEFIRKKGVYSFLRNISKLKTEETASTFTAKDLGNVELVEAQITEEYIAENPHEFNYALPQLMQILSVEQSEEEKGAAFENRLMDELYGLLKLEDVI